MAREPSEDAIIWQMARKHFEDRQRRMAGGAQWGSLSESQRDVEFDAMWHALHELLMPSEAMQREGFLANIWTNSSEIAVGRVTMPADKAWTAMVNKLLEV